MARSSARHPSPPLCELRSDLLGAQPEVWRLLRLSSGIVLPRLARVLLAAMGWFRAEDWWFEAAGTRYGEPNEETGRHDAATVRLRHVLPDTGHELWFVVRADRTLYQHRLRVDRLLPPDRDRRDPVCLAGSGTVPTATARATGFDVSLTNAELARLR